MAMWPMTEDDFEAMELERFDRQRPEEERQRETSFLQQQDLEGEIEDQDILAQLHRESLEADPEFLYDLKEREEEYERLEAEQEAAERFFRYGPSFKATAEPIAPQSTGPMLPQFTPAENTSKSVQLSETSVQATPENTTSATSQPQGLVPNQNSQKELTSPQQAVVTQREKDESVPLGSQKPQKEKSSKFTPYDIAQELIKYEHFVVIKNAIYWYNKLIYKFLSREYALRLIVDRCRMAVKEVGNGNFVEQVFKCLQQEPSLVDNDLLPAPDVVVFLDGVLNLKTGDFTEHSPKVFATSYLNASYSNGLVTACPRFDRFISTAANGNSLWEKRAWEMMGYIFTQDQRGKVFFVLQGLSGSGKSVLGNFIRTGFNKDSISSLDLHSFGKNFSKSDLIGKRLCLDLDLPAGPIDAKAISSLKSLQAVILSRRTSSICRWCPL